MTQRLATHCTQPAKDVQPLGAAPALLFTRSRLSCAALTHPPMRKMITLVWTLLALSAQAQDYPQYTQFYNNLPFLNPSLVGSSGEQFLLTSNYRNQWGWGNLGYGYRTQAFGLEYAATYTGWNFGMSYTQDVSGDARYQQDFFSFSTSYILRVSDLSALSLGVALDYRAIGMTGAYIGFDDLNAGNLDPTMSSYEKSEGLNFSGGLTFMMSNWWIGASYRDIMRDPVYLSGDGQLFSPNRNQPYGMWSLHTGLTMPLGSPWQDQSETINGKTIGIYKYTLFYFANYKQQGLLNQFEFGSMLQRRIRSYGSGGSPLTLNFGGSYRSFATTHGLDQRDAFALHGGFRAQLRGFGALMFNASHDLTVSDLNSAASGVTGGAWEFSIGLSLSSYFFVAANKIGYDNGNILAPRILKPNIWGKGSNSRSERRYIHMARPNSDCPSVQLHHFSLNPFKKGRDHNRPMRDKSLKKKRRGRKR